MESLSHIELSFSTILIASLIPFIFFLYHSKLSHDSALERRADLIYLTLISIGLVVLILRLFSIDQNDFASELKLTILHLLPLMQGVFQVFFFQKKFSRAAVGQGTKLKTASGPVNDEVEDISWDDLIIDENLRKELISIIELLRSPENAARYGIQVPKGILLNGPPGTGKTTIAKVVANEAGLSFFALKLDEVVSKWVGDSEKNLTALFQSAINAAPAVLFVDEIDSIGKQRSGAGGQEHRESLLNHLLQLMDGVVKTEGLYIIAATNRADLVDAALKRPGRLNKVIEIGLPDEVARKRLFELYLSKLNLEDSVNVSALVDVTEGKSPAVIREICNQAGLNAFKRESEQGSRTGKVSRVDIERAAQEYL